MIIGLTGRISSGKNSVAIILQEKGFISIDVDLIGHRLLKAPAVIAQVIDSFGNSVLTGNEIDRNKLADIVFNDSAALSRLESILHPLMKSEIKQILRQISDNVVINAAVLFEMRLDEVCDQVWVVDAPDESIRSRLQSKGYTAQQIDHRIAAQKSADEYKLKANVLIVNDGTFDQLRLQVDSALHLLPG